MSSRLVLVLLAYVTTSTAGLLLMRSVLKRPDADLLSIETLTSGRLMLGGLLYCVSFAFWLMALARFNLTTAYPFFIGVGYTSIMFCSIVFLGEPISLTKAIGAVLVGAGLLLVASGSAA